MGGSSETQSSSNGINSRTDCFKGYFLLFSVRVCSIIQTNSHWDITVMMRLCIFAVVRDALIIAIGYNNSNFPKDKLFIFYVKYYAVDSSLLFQ